MEDGKKLDILENEYEMEIWEKLDRQIHTNEELRIPFANCISFIQNTI